MRPTTNFMRTLLAAALVVGCDNVADTPAPTPEPEPTATVDEVAAYRVLAMDVDGHVRDYQTAVDVPELTQATCLTLHADYDARVRPVIMAMINKATALDDFIGVQLGAPDLACGAQALMDELDDHNHIACMWPEAGRNRAEAVRHVAVMLRYTLNAQERCDEMVNGLTGAGWTWHPMFCAY
jgi:hypothetical protein